MPDTVNTIAATLRFSADAAPNFYDLANPICWCLRQADIRIRFQDLGLTGDSMAFVTDHGTISLVRNQISAKKIEILIEVEADHGHDLMVARQVAYQLIRRLCHRAKITSIVWQPGHQILRPAQFSWAALQDMPRRLNEATQSRGHAPMGAVFH